MGETGSLELIEHADRMLIGELENRFRSQARDGDFNTDSAGLGHMLHKVDQRQFAVAWKQTTEAGFVDQSFESLRRTGGTVEIGFAGTNLSNELAVDRWILDRVAQMNVPQIASRDLVEIGSGTTGTVQMQGVNGDGTVGATGHLDEFIGLFQRADGTPRHEFKVNAEAVRFGHFAHLGKHSCKFGLVRSIAADAQLCIQYAIHMKNKEQKSALKSALFCSLGVI